jgi:hypothetical protein
MPGKRGRKPSPLGASKCILALCDFTRTLLTNSDTKWIARPALTELIYADRDLWDRLINAKRRSLIHDTANIRSRFARMDAYISRDANESGLRCMLRKTPQKAVYYYLPEVK